MPLRGVGMLSDLDGMRPLREEAGGNAEHGTSIRDYPAVLRTVDGLTSSTLGGAER
jgi:hypothetical protein